MRTYRPNRLTKDSEEDIPMVKNNREFMRVYHAVLQDIERWDGKEPIEEFLTKILEKKLLINRKEAESIALQILSGIVSYKKAKETLKEKPQLLQEIIDKVDKNTQKELVEEVMEIFKTINRSANDGEEKGI
jgi:ATP-dependent Clp protease adapter protein ClpS